MKMLKGRASRIAVALVLVTGTGIAGFQIQNSAISVAGDSNLKSIDGSLGAGHYNGTSRYIGCQIVGQSTTSVPVVTCAATDAQGNNMSCAPPLGGFRMISSETHFNIANFQAGNNCEVMNSDVSSSNAIKSADGNSASTGVSITTSGNDTIAKGALGTVYRSSDNAQQMGCKLKASVNFSTGAQTSTVTCSAYDNSSTQKSLICTATSASIIQAALAIRPDSYLEITKNGSTCTKLLVKNDSRYDSHNGARR